MDIAQILSAVDHTVLAQTSTWEQIRQCCEDGLRYHTASVCIPPVFVARAKQFAGSHLSVCTVIGFPNGYSTRKAKCLEAQDALDNGADELDMVINLTDVKDGHYNAVEEEIRAIKEVCGVKILKVIIETCLLTEEEKIRMCKVITDAKADFIKTSTGFSTQGATREDVALFQRYIGPDVKIKAAGGIRSFQDAEDFIRLGCARLGTSRIVSLVKKMENEHVRD